MNPAAWTAALSVLVIALGCGSRAHITRTHGRSFQQAFAAQKAAPDAAKPAKAVDGLDSQEATIIADTYRKSLVPKGEKVEEPQVLLLAPPQPKEKLAPSVPMR